MIPGRTRSVLPRVPRPAGACLALALASSVAFAACSGGSATKAPSQPGSGGTAAGATPCSATGASSYPGWPGDGTPLGSSDLIPEVVSTELSVGPDRFLMTIVDGKNNLLASKNLPVDLRFYALGRDPATPAATTSAIFMDSGTGLGLYRAPVTFTCSGDWGVEVVAHRPSGDNTSRIVFPVEAQSTTPAIGAPAPHAETPTATDAAGIAAISTDPKPDPDFYRMTITQAVTSGKPSLIIFATPAFCRTQVCGPTLDLVKQAAADFKGKMNFVNVEPYIMQNSNAGLQPVLDKDGQLQPVQSVDTYGLQTEPYTFVVDAQGKVAARFEGIVEPDELRPALLAVTGQGK